MPTAIHKRGPADAVVAVKLQLAPPQLPRRVLANLDHPKNRGNRWARRALAIARKVSNPPAKHHDPMVVLPERGRGQTAVRPKRDNVAKQTVHGLAVSGQPPKGMIGSLAGLLHMNLNWVLANHVAAGKLD